MNQKIKVDGKVGNLADHVKISRDKNVVAVSAQAPFSKRYLKYLTKKYLKKEQRRDIMRVVSNGPSGYTLKYFNIADGEDAGEQ